MLWFDLTMCDVAATANTQNVLCLKDSLEMIGIVSEGRRN